MKNKISISVVFVFITFVSALAQQKDKNITTGNKQFGKEDFRNAEASYRKSQFKNPTSSNASYNLGNAIYKQNQKSEAKLSYIKAIQTATTKEEKHQAFHNLGNVLMAEKDYAGAVESYKNALRNNPNDEQTRYNFALAKEMLKKNPPQNNDNDKDKDKDKDQDKNQNPNQDNKDQQKDKQDDQDQKDQDQPKPDDKDQKDNKKSNPDEQKQQNPQQSNANKQQMQNMLDALSNEERRIQEKVKGQEVKGKPLKSEKDW